MRQIIENLISTALHTPLNAISHIIHAQRLDGPEENRRVLLVAISGNPEHVAIAQAAITLKTDELQTMFRELDDTNLHTFMTVNTGNDAPANAVVLDAEDAEDAGELLLGQIRDSILAETGEDDEDDDETDYDETDYDGGIYCECHDYTQEREEQEAAVTRNALLLDDEPQPAARRRRPVEGEDARVLEDIQNHLLAQYGPTPEAVRRFVAVAESMGYIVEVNPDGGSGQVYYAD